MHRQRQRSDQRSNQRSDTVRAICRLAAAPIGTVSLVLVVVLTVMLSACQPAPPEPLSALAFFEQGNRAHEEEQYPRAVHFYRRALEADAQLAAAWYNLGLTYYRMAAWQQAQQALEKLLELRPHDPAAHHNLALVFYRLHDASRADAHYHRYLDLVHSSRQPPGKRNNGRASSAAAPTPSSAASPSAVVPVRSGRTARAGGRSQRTLSQPPARAGGRPRESASSRTPALKNSASPADNPRETQRRRAVPDLSRPAGDEPWWNQGQFLHGRQHPEQQAPNQRQ